MSIKKLHSLKGQSGFGIVEVIVAMGLFVIIAITGVTAVTGSFSTNRLGEWETRATTYAQSGLEAVRSIKNRDWDTGFLSQNCSAGCGVSLVNGAWEWSGAGNTQGNLARKITVFSVQRDTNGNIVTSGGVEDPDTRKVESEVIGNFTSTRINKVKVSTYLTNFRKPIGGELGGIMVFGGNTGSSTFSKFHESSNKITTESPPVSSSGGLSFMLRTSPTAKEAVSGYVTSGGTLYVSCYNGSTWSNEWSENVGGSGTTRRFDISYETGSGDVIVLYSTNSGSSNEMAYRTKSGSSACGNSNWSNPSYLDPARTNGVVQWVKMAWDRKSGSDLIAAIWADSNSDLSAKIWSGSSWVNEPANTTESSLEFVSASQDVDDFDVEFESASGDVMVVWANSAGSNRINGVRYRTCVGGIANCTWSSVNTPPTFADDATNLDISANPLSSSNEMVFASIGNAGSDLQMGYWNGSSWTNSANTDVSVETPLARTGILATGWLVSGNNSRSVVVYNDMNARNIGYYASDANDRSLFTSQADFTPSPALANPQIWYDIQMNPFNTDSLLLTVLDSKYTLHSKLLTMSGSLVFSWSNVEGGNTQINLSDTIPSPFSFAFWRHE